MKKRIISVILTLALLFTDVCGLGLGAFAEGDTGIQAALEDSAEKPVETEKTPDPEKSPESEPEKAETKQTETSDETGESAPAESEDSSATTEENGTNEAAAEAGETDAPSVTEEKNESGSDETEPAETLETEENTEADTDNADEENGSSEIDHSIEETNGDTEITTENSDTETEENGTEEADEPETESEPEIDYTRSLKYSPAFKYGYVKLSSDSEIFKTSDDKEAYATVSSGIVYAVSRVHAGEYNDKLKIAFFSDEELTTAYVSASSATALDEAAVNAYTGKRTNDKEYTFYYKEELPVDGIVVTLFAVKETEPEQADENTETEKEPASTDDTETEQGIENTEPEQADENAETEKEPAATDDKVEAEQGNENTAPEQTGENNETDDESAVTVENNEPEQATDNTDAEQESQNTEPETADDTSVADPATDVAVNVMAFDAVSVPRAAKVEFTDVPEKLGVGQTYRIYAKALFEDGNAAGESVCFAVELPDHAEITCDGVITALSEGVVKVIASTDSGVVASAEIEIVAEPAEIKLDSASAIVCESGTLLLTYTLSSGSAGNVTWQTSDGNVAKVSDDGIVTGVKAGTAVITVTTYNGLKDECAVTVMAEPTDINLSAGDLTVSEGETVTLSAFYTGYVTGKASFDVVSGDGEVALIYKNENEVTIKGIRSGIAVIRATAQNAALGSSFEAFCIVTINPAVVSIVFENAPGKIGVGETVDLRPVALDGHGNPVEAKFTYTTSNKSYLTLKGNLVYGARTGSAKVTVKAENGVSAETSLTVMKTPSSIKLSNSDLSLNVKQKAQLTYTLSSGSASQITWTSSDPAVASVDKDGNVTALSAGTAVITAVTYKTSIKATCTVKVYANPVSVSMAKEEYTVQEGMTVTPSVVFEPAGAWGKVTYSAFDCADDTSSISVDADTGVVTGITEGWCTVVGVAHNYETGEDVSASAKVTVIPKAEKIELGTDRLTIGVGETIDLEPVALDRYGNSVLTPFTMTANTTSYLKTVGGTSVTGVRTGNTKVTVKTANGTSLTVNITVAKAPDKLVLSASNVALSIGETANLTYTIANKGATAITWESSDESVVTVCDGKLCAVGAGTAEIICKTYLERVYGRCVVTVYDAPTGIHFDEEAYTVNENGTVTVSAVIEPVTAIGKIEYTVTGDDELLLAEVNGNIVTGKYSGTAVLTASVYSHKDECVYTASCPVNVLPAPVKVAFTSNRTTIGVNETVDLKPVAYDARGNEVETEFTVTASSNSYVKVTGTLVTGLRTGTVKLTLASENGVKTTVTYKVTGAPSKVYISSGELKLIPGETASLSAWTVAGEEAAIEWTSADAETVSVTDEGIVCANAVGSAVITAASYNGKTAQCVVYVCETPTGIAFTQDNCVVTEGKSYMPAVQILPEGTWANVEYSASDSDSEYEIATVNEKTGEITGVTSGKAVVTAKVTNFVTGEVLTAQLNVEVIPGAVRVELEDLREIIGYGESETLKPVAYDARGTEVEAEFTVATSNKTNVRVSELEIKGAHTGKADITVTAKDGASTKVQITVQNAPKSVSLDKTELTLQKGSEAALKAVIPSGQMSLISWESLDDSIVAVDENGTVSAVGEGTTRVKVSTFNGRTAYCTVNVKACPDSIAFETESVRVAAASAVTYKAVLSPENAYADVVYTSSNADAAVVDPVSGKILGVSAGQTVITASAYSYDKAEYITAELTVYVSEPAITVDTGCEGLVLGVGESFEIEPRAYDASGNLVETDWTVVSGNTKYVTVSGMKLKAVRTGTCDVTVTAKNGASVKLTVTVRSAPSRIALSPTSVIVSENENYAVSVVYQSGQMGGVTWTSSDDSIAVVDEDGVITGVAAGTAKITAKTFNGKTAVCTVTVKRNPKSIEFEKMFYEVGENASVQTGLVFAPEGSFSRVSYEFTPITGEAEVNDEGKVTGKLSGIGVLVAKGYNYKTGEELTAVCDIEIVPAPVKIVFTETRKAIGVKETLELKPVAYDGRGNVTDTLFTLKADSRYLKISDTTVTGVRAGKTSVTVTASNGLSISREYQVLAETSKVSISRAAANLTVYGNVKLSAVANNAVTSPVTWTSSDESVVTVSATGLVSAVGVGKATVTAKSYNGKTAVCNVTVLPEADSVAFTADEIKIGCGDKVKAETILPEGTLSDVVYASANPFIAQIDKNTGVISALTEGETTVTATVYNHASDTYFTAEVNVTVYPAPVKLAFSNPRTDIGLGEIMNLGAIALDANGNETAATFKYASSASGYISVSSDGTVKGVKAGKATITVTAYNGVSLKVNLVCTKAPSEVKLNASKLTISEADIYQLKATLNSGTSSKLYWASGSLNVATVDENGLITAHGYGETVITCTTYNGRTATCSLTVLYEPDGIEFAEDSVSVGEGATLTVNAALNPEHQGIVRYYSDDSDIAVVDEVTGKVTGISAGTTVIRATTVNRITGESYSDELTVNVTPKPASVRIVMERTSIGVGETLMFSAVAYDKDGNETPSAFTYASSSSSYLNVTSNRARGMRAGTVTLKATAYNGVSGTVSVKVVAAPSAISMTVPSVNAIVGWESVKLNYKLTGTGAVSTITWASEDTDIATVDQNGNVTAVSTGTTRVKATTYNNKSAYCTIRVYNLPETITLDRHAVTLGAGQASQLSYVLDENAGGSVSWISGDTTIATVSASGNITAVSAGETVITAETLNGKQDICTVTVKPAPLSIGLTQSTIAIGKGEVYDVSNLVKLSEGSCTTLTCAVESSRILSLSGTSVKALNTGSTRVKITTHNGKSVLLTVKVQSAPTTFKIEPDRSVIYADDVLMFRAVYSSSVAGTVTFESSNPEVLEIAENGAAIAHTKGTATITGTAYNGIRAVLEVEVLRHVDSVTLDTGDLEITHYDTYALKATVLPEDATDKKVTWTSSDPSKVSVDENGVITANGITDEPVRVTCASIDNNRFSVCYVTVTPVRLSSIELSETDVTLERGRSAEVGITFTPDNADDKSVIWTSSDESVVTVLDGVITAVSDSGSALVTCASNDGGHTKTISVKATKVHVRNVETDVNELTIRHYDSQSVNAYVYPEDADLSSASWFSSNSGIASVDEAGNIIANGVGSCVIGYTVTDAFGTQKTANIAVTVTPVEVTGIELGSGTMFMRVNTQKLLAVNIYPENADNKNVNWVLSQNGIVSGKGVSEGVMVTGTKTGVVRATATTVDGGFTAACDIHVVGALGLDVVPNHEKNTTGNMVVWRLTPENSVGEISYEITLTKDGQLLNIEEYDSNTGVVIENAQPGVYHITAVVTDADGSTATDESTVTVADSYQISANGVVFSYRVGVTANGMEGAFVKLVSAPDGTSSITVPRDMDGNVVVRIDTEAFMDLTSLKSVQIPATASEIGARAFKGCTALTAINNY